MRKLLGLLVAVAFVATATTAFAQSISLSTITAGSTSQKDTFMAEVVFDVSGTFGFVLKKADDAALPKSGDTAAAKVDWIKKDGSTFIDGVAPGAPGFINSQVYAEVKNDLAVGTSVQFYTDNFNATGEYKLNAAADKRNINPLVESVGGSATTNFGLPLAYVFLSSETVFDVAASTNITMNPAQQLEKISDIHIMNADGTNQSIYAFFVKDSTRTVRPANTNYPGDAGDVAYSKKDATIALNNVTQRGNRAVAKSNTDPAYTAGTPTGEFWYVPADTAYMFFSTNFTDAVGGFKYGTEDLTLEMTVDGNY